MNFYSPKEKKNVLSLLFIFFKVILKWKRLYYVKDG